MAHQYDYEDNEYEKDWRSTADANYTILAQHSSMDDTGRQFPVSGNDPTESENFEHIERYDGEGEHSYHHHHPDDEEQLQQQNFVRRIACDGFGILFYILKMSEFFGAY